MLEEARAHIGRWLLDSPIQIPSGAQKGGVGGWVTASGRATFVYTEITGYFLTCLAFMRTVGELPPTRLVARAESAIDWLWRKTQEDRIGVCRHYLVTSQSDWRNDLVFAFDLAMVLRGLEMGRRYFANPQIQETMDAVWRQLQKHRGLNHSLISACSLNGNPIPRHWSTEPGLYQMKIAAALRSCASANSQAWSRQIGLAISCNLESRPSEALAAGGWHPFFYYLEGMVLLSFMEGEAHGLKKACSLWKSRLNPFSLSNLTDASSEEGLPRSDVLAQALRLACILRSQGFLQEGGWSHALEEMAEALLRFVNQDGGVAFILPPPGGELHWNSWSAMFAYQALTFYRQIQSGRNIDSSWICLLI